MERSDCDLLEHWAYNTPLNTPHNSAIVVVALDESYQIHCSDVQ
jgi:hypothetical protein